jgi:hypothetical protein
MAFIAAAALVAPVRAQTPRLGGFLSLDRRFEIGGDSVLVADFYNRFRPEVSSVLGERLYLFASLDVRFYDFGLVRSASDLEDVERSFPTELTLWEGYVELREFLVDGLDVTVGKQRIQWGTADELNPTDQLNAYDLSDLVNFTARVPTWAVRADYYLGDKTLTAVWSPTVHAPVMPRGGAALFLRDGSALAPGGVRITSLDDRIEPPSRRLTDGLLAFKIAGHAGRFDYSFSYMIGFDGIPALKRLDLVPAGEGAEADELAGLMTLGLPRTQFVGADFATEAGGVGLWGEAALVFPERVETVTTLAGQGIVDRSVTLDDQPYVRSTLGLDYTFGGGWYVNAQWAHGLFFQRGTDNLYDYFVGRVEQSFLRDELRMALGGALEVGSWTGISDNLGFGAFPELTYSPMDNLEWVVGLFLVGGRGTSLFRAWDETDQLYARVKVSF